MSWPILALVSAVLFGVAAVLAQPRKNWDPRGKHCYVTGGSSGTGLALAILLTKKGADVSIVARNQKRLDDALVKMEAVRQTPNQVLKAYSYSLTEAEASDQALAAACEPYCGESPDACFLCAGTAKPGFFVEETVESMKAGMESSYWTQAWSAYAAAKRMAQDGTQGKIIFVSSLLGYMSFAGYSTYSPAKFALRGLAEALRSELQLYNIDVHICFPATILSPGYEEENRTKPKITLKIEESDEGLPPEIVAEKLLDGVQRGLFHIPLDLITNIFRSSTRGSTPYNNFILDGIYEMIGSIACLLWRRSVDSAIQAHRAEHLVYLRERGFRGKGIDSIR